MPQIIETKDGLLRINFEKNILQLSPSGGRSWVNHCIDTTSYGVFRDLILYQGEVFAATSQGIYASKTGGRSFTSRFKDLASTGDFLSLFVDGTVLIANTTNGLRFSRNGGYSWMRQ